MSLSAILVVTRAGLAGRRGRLAAAAFAIALAGSVQLAVMAAYTNLHRRALPLAHAALMDAEAVVTATDPAWPAIPADLVEALRADPRVAHLDAAWRIQAFVHPGTAEGAIDPARMDVWDDSIRQNLWASLDDGPRPPLLAGRWPDPAALDPIECAVASFGVGGAAAAVGDWLRLESDSGAHRARVVGTFAAGDASVAQELPRWRIAAPAAGRLAGGARPVADALVHLRPDADAAAFAADWGPRLRAAPGRIELRHAGDLAAGWLARVPGMGWARSTALIALVLTTLAVLCLGLAVQAAAVRERTARYALVRALGGGRATLSAAVLAESALLAGLGAGGAFLLAWAYLAGAAAAWPALPGAGSHPDLPSTLVTGASLVAGVLLGGLWPALAAARVRPADAEAARVDPARAAALARRGALAAGLVLVAATAAVLVTGDRSPARGALLLWLGIPALTVAGVLATPALVRACSRLLAPAAGRLLRVDPLLLGDQLAGDVPRSAGSVVAMTVGLGAFVWVLCWGASMTDAFRLDPAIPRRLVTVQPHGLDAAEAARVAATPAFAGMRPFVFVDTRLAADRERHATWGWQDGCLVVGAGGLDALPLRLVAGRAEDAAAALAGDGSCLILDWHARGAGLRPGDQVEVAVPGAPDAVRAYRVAGVVAMQGWIFATKFAKLRLRNSAHAAFVIVGLDVARRDFPAAHVGAWWGPAAPGGDSGALTAAVRGAVDLDRPLAYPSDAGGMVAAHGRWVHVADLDQAQTLLERMGEATVRAMGHLPLIALALSLASVAGTLVAALRARARELGVLRACGLTRAGLLRLALAECLVLGIAAAGLAAAFGAGAAALVLAATTIAGYYGTWQGMDIRFIVPWPWLWPGAVVAAVVCGGAAAWAAWRIGRQRPADLLAGARGHP